MLELRNDNREVVKMDYAIADLWQLQKYAPAFRGDRGLLKQLIDFVDQITNNQEYGIIDFKEGVILLKKDAMSEKKAVDEWVRFREQV